MESRYTWEEAKELHYKLWDELAQSGTSYKFETRTYPKYPAINDCYCCEVVWENGCLPCTSNASLCPIKWTWKTIFSKLYDNDTPCEYPGTLYTKWKKSLDPEERKRLAAKIRDLSWRLK
jgi:hypothetical protein